MQSESLNLSGIWVPLVTPFKGGAVDHAGLRRIVARCADGGVSGFRHEGESVKASWYR